MADGIDLNDAEYVWPPGALQHERPAPGPEIAGMRLDSVEQRLANLERGRGDIQRQLVDIGEAIHVAIDALTYLSGAVERVKALFGQGQMSGDGR
jgi:hypothetical protein